MVQELTMAVLVQAPCSGASTHHAMTVLVQAPCSGANTHHAMIILVQAPCSGENTHHGIAVGTIHMSSYLGSKHQICSVKITVQFHNKMKSEYGYEEVEMKLL